MDLDTDTMRDYYTSGLWPIEYLDNLLQKKRITQEQYDMITGAVVT